MRPWVERYTIEQLAAEVSRVLGPEYVGVGSGRVRDLPDARTIRYYTTLGLLDRPAEMRGRLALYGRRHALQLASIKRLQSQGLALAEIQRRLVGLSDSMLERTARGEVAAVAAPAADPPPPRPESPSSAGPSGSVSTAPEAIRLHDAVALVLRPAREMTDRDRSLIRMATAPVLELLRLHGLIDAPSPTPEIFHGDDGDAADR